MLPGFASDVPTHGQRLFTGLEGHFQGREQAFAGLISAQVSLRQCRAAYFMSIIKRKGKIGAPLGNSICARR